MARAVACVSGLLSWTVMGPPPECIVSGTVMHSITALANSSQNKPTLQSVTVPFSLKCWLLTASILSSLPSQTTVCPRVSVDHNSTVRGGGDMLRSARHTNNRGGSMPHATPQGVGGPPGPVPPGPVPPGGAACFPSPGEPSVLLIRGGGAFPPARLSPLTAKSPASSREINE